MIIGKKLRLGLIGIGVMGAIAALSILAGTFRADETDAGTPAGTYIMSVSAPASATIGAPFMITLSLSHGATPAPDCSLATVPGAFGCYQAAQWTISYDPTIINAGANCQPSCPQIVRVPAAPTACTSEAVSSTDSRIQAGCLSIAGADLDYQGDVFNITVQCSTNGQANFTLVTAGSPNTFVNDGATDQPVQVNSDATACGTGATATPTATETPVPAATNTPQPPATATPCPTTGCTTPTVAPRNTNTPTPPVTGTPGAETPGTGETPPPPPPPGGGTPTGGGGGTGTGGGGGSGGVITGPDTGTGGGAGGSGGMSWIIAGLALAGAMVIGGGAVLRRAVRTSR